MPGNNSMDDLREHLFATLRGLQDKDAPMDIERARAVANVAGVLIDSARVEVEYSKVTGTETGSRFLAAPKDADEPALPPGITGIRQHRIK